MGCHLYAVMPMLGVSVEMARWAKIGCGVWGMGGVCALCVHIHISCCTHPPPSLQQFVKDTGSFVSEMAQALLNGLTGGRHRKLLEAAELKGKEQVSGKRGGVEQAEGDSVGGARSIGEAVCYE